MPKKTLALCPTCGGPMPLLERNVAIVREREQGATLEAIAQRYGLTRARVHAICGKAEKWKGLSLSIAKRAGRVTADSAKVRSKS